MFTVRTYKTTDYEMLAKWFIYALEHIPVKTAYTEDSTFIVEYNGDPIASACLYLTNCKEHCYLEHFVASPEFKANPIRKEATMHLLEYIAKFAKDNGYKRVVGIGYKDGVKKRIREWGFRHTADVSVFVKELRN
jgi:hypothetical protein